MTFQSRARAFAGRARRSALRRLTPPAPTFATALPRPVPAGWSEPELRAVMDTFTIDDAPLETLAGYVDEASGASCTRGVACVTPRERRSSSARTPTS